MSDYSPIRRWMFAWLLVIGCFTALAWLLSFAFGPVHETSPSRADSRLESWDSQHVDRAKSVELLARNASGETSEKPSSLATIHVTVIGAQLDETVYIALFDAARDFPDPTRALRLTSEPVQSQPLNVVLRDLPYGTYALAVFADQDGNQSLSRGPFGIPAEPYGFSKNARGKFGPPPFEHAAFGVEQPSFDLEIEVR